VGTAHEEQVRRWQAARDRSLRRPDGWLSLVGLFWLKEGQNRVGSDPHGDVVLPRGPPIAGSIDVRDGDAIFEADPDAGVLHDGQPFRSLRLRTDRDGDPTRLTVDFVVFHLIDRQGGLAVRVRDPKSPVLRSFRGAEYFSIDDRWRVEAEFEPSFPPRSVLAPNVIGSGEHYEVPGTLSFEIDGHEYRLEAFREPGERNLFVVFGDLTNGAETYLGGRYVYTKAPKTTGRVVLDFNRAYNPPCVFTPHATCVLPLPENRLPIRIEAGEKAYR
jgi:uncharacterized protein